jgi:O-antigen ligase
MVDRGPIRILTNIYFVGLFLLPLDMPASIAAHGVLKRSIGDPYILFLPTVVTAVIAACLIPCIPRQGWWQAGWLTNYLSVGVLFCLVGIAGVVATAAHGGDLSFALRQLVLGFLAPIIAVAPLTLLEPQDRHKAFRFFFAGWVFYLALSIPVLYVAWTLTAASIPLFADANLGVQIYLWRFMQLEEGGSTLYGDFIGNANKTSNYVLLFLLFSTLLLQSKERVNHLLIGSFWVLGLLTLIFLFSRAALLLLPLVIWGSAITSNMSRRTFWLLLLAVFVTASFALEEMAAIIFRLLFATQQHSGVQGPALETLGDRFDQWRQLHSFWVDFPGTLITGIGTSQYGRLFFGDPYRGTHNMFLDALLESGVLGFFALVMTLVLSLLLALFLEGRAKKVAVIGTGVLILLMNREHSAAYLFATSMGGLCFAFLFLIASRRVSGPYRGLELLKPPSGGTVPLNPGYV